MKTRYEFQLVALDENGKIIKRAAKYKTYYGARMGRNRLNNPATGERTHEFVITKL